MQESAMAPGAQPVDRRSIGLPKLNSAVTGYGMLLALAIVGWLLRDLELLTPESGVGYWLGIVGGSLMLALLLYPVRKRFRFMSRLGATRYWFQMHMILGLVGPLLILYHCNFRLGSFNSRVAFWTMVLVAASGVVGKHFYTRIHRGLYGRKTSLRELQAELAASVEKGRSVAALMPGLASRLNALATELQGCEVTQSLGVGRSLKWTITHRFTQLSLWWTARKELKQAATSSDSVRRDIKRYRRLTWLYIRNFTSLLGRVAQFSFYERLFALWHVFHLPFFLMMVLSAIAHVIAVHMY